MNKAAPPEPGLGPAPRSPDFSEEAWSDVLGAIDRTYQELVEHQSQLEARNGELEGLRAFLASILASMTDVLLVTGPDARVLEANPAFLALAARDKADVVGAPVADLFAAESRAAVAADLSALRDGAPPPHAERALATPDGPAPLELSLAARTDRRGRHVGAVLLGRPLGELRRAYQEMEVSHRALKEAQSALVHSEKLASLGRLVAGVAHELNNPISFVYGNAHALERYTAKFESYFEQVETGASREDLIALRRSLKLDRAVRQMRAAVSGALEGAERVRGIVDDLRRLSAEGGEAMEPFDLADCARTAAHWVLKGRGATVDLDLDGLAPCPALGRGGHIQQVVMNLVQNALDAMAGTPAPRLILATARTRDACLLTVEDDGPGIPEEALLHLFDPFFTTKPVGEGTGLGLSISYKIMEEHGGALTAENRAEGGARFRLALPRAERAA